MNTKSLSRLCGILFLATVIVFIVGNMVLKEPLQDTEDYSNTFQLVQDSASQYRLGNFLALIGLTAQFALMITLYQILQAVNPFLALLALGWRVGEQVLLTAGIIASLVILGLSETVTLAPGGGIELDYVAQVLVSAPVHAQDIAFVFLGVASIFNNVLFFKGKMIPSSLALFGVLSAALYALGAALPMLGLAEAFKMLTLPLILFELSLGVYLTFWGIKESA